MRDGVQASPDYSRHGCLFVFFKESPGSIFYVPRFRHNRRANSSRDSKGSCIDGRRDFVGFCSSSNQRVYRFLGGLNKSGESVKVSIFHDMFSYWGLSCTYLGSVPWHIVHKPMEKDYGLAELAKELKIWPHTLAGLPTFCPMTFHLLFSYSLMALRRAWLC
jgi:hypothetical protein